MSLPSQTLLGVVYTVFLFRDFLGLIWDRISSRPNAKMSKNFPKWCIIIIPNFLVLCFGENFMKMRTKKAKLQMYENLQSHFYANLKSFFMKGN